MRIIVRVSKLLTSVERGTTLRKGITVHADRAGANGAMVAGVATGVDTADTGSRAASARIDTLIAVASLIGAAIGVIDTLSTTTRDKRIAQVSSATEADRSVVATPICSGFTIRIHSARIRVTQVIFVEGTAAVERMSSEAFGA